MESCEEEIRSSESDSNIISFMGNPDLNFVDSPLMAYDTRTMLDIVRSGMNGDDNLIFPASFHHLNENSVSTILPNNIPGDNEELSSNSPTLLSSVNIVSSIMPKISPSSQGNEVLPASVTRAQEDSQIYQMNLDNTPQSSTTGNDDMSSSPSDEVSDTLTDPLNSSNGLEQSNEPDPLNALHTPPLNPPDLSMYYSETQSPVSVTISRNCANTENVSGLLPSNGYVFYSSSEEVLNNKSHPIHSSNALTSPNNQLPQHNFNVKRERNDFHLINLKQENRDFAHDNNEPLLSSPSMNHHVTYSSFANMNLSREPSSLDIAHARLVQRNSFSGVNHLNVASNNSLLSPIRTGQEISSSNTNTQNHSTPRNNNQVQNSFHVSSPAQQILEPSFSISRPPTAHVQLQQHLQQQTTHQQHLFQSIPLQNATINPQNHNSPLGDCPDSIGSFHHTHIYDEHHQESISNASRNLSFNYTDAMLSPNGLHTPHLISSGYHSKTGKMHNKVNGSRLKDEDNFESCSSDSLSNESEDDSLVIDTSSIAEGFECGECKEVCRTRGSLRKHLATVHLTNEPEPAETMIKQYVCPLSICGFATTLRDELDRHIAEHINDGWTPTGKKRHNKNPLQRHRYNKEEFQCPHCEYSCTVEKAFNRHVAIHETASDSTSLTLDKVSCQICGKDRPNDEAMRVHMKKHRKGKYYKCDICKFKSVQLKKLIQHRRMHTGEKPHLCPYCVYRAARRDNLRSHVRRMHKKDNMFCDTFTPRPLLLAQGETAVPQKHNNNKGLIVQSTDQLQQRQLMGVPHHQTNVSQQMALMDRLHQQHHQHSQQMTHQSMTPLAQHGIGVNTLSPNHAGSLPASEQQHLHSGNILIYPSNTVQHMGMLSSPQGI